MLTDSYMGKGGGYLICLRKHFALKTIKPTSTSVEAERAFSATVFYSKNNDKTLDAFITLRQYYESKKTLKMTNKTNFQN